MPSFKSKQDQIEYNKKRREKYANDAEFRKKRLEQDRKYRERMYKNPEWVENKKKRDKISRDKTKEQKNLLKKERYANDPEYRKRKAEQDKKSRQNSSAYWVSRRTRRGIKFHIDGKEYHQYWLNKTNCDFCNKVFENNKQKGVEHHHPSGYIRGIACISCNMKIASVDLKKNYVLLELHRLFARL